MRISVTDAKGQLTDLVRRAEAGEEVVLTRHGQPAARLVAVKDKLLDPATRRKLMEEIGVAGAAKATPGPDAARSQDFLYDEYGLPK
jgi:prevent-host-death family protein